MVIGAVFQSVTGWLRVYLCLEYCQRGGLVIETRPSPDAQESHRKSPVYSRMPGHRNAGDGVPRKLRFLIRRCGCGAAILAAILSLLVAAIGIRGALFEDRLKKRTALEQTRESRDRWGAMVAIDAIRAGRSHTLALYRTTNCDDVLELASKLPGLEEVTLDRTDVTDRGIRHLSRAGSLKKVTLLWCMGVTDAAIECLARIRSLQEVVLCDLPISDAGIAHLKQSPQLAVLELVCPADTRSITPNVIEHLGHCYHLRRLVLDVPWLDKTGAQSLRRHLPKTNLRLFRGSGSRCATVIDSEDDNRK